MKTLEIIIFFVIFIITIFYFIITINNVEELVEKDKEKQNRQALEAENSEFEYGHNVKNYMEKNYESESKSNRQDCRSKKQKF